MKNWCGNLTPWFLTRKLTTTHFFCFYLNFFFFSIFCPCYQYQHFHCQYMYKDNLVFNIDIGNAGIYYRRDYPYKTPVKYYYLLKIVACDCFKQRYRCYFVKKCIKCELFEFFILIYNRFFRTFIGWILLFLTEKNIYCLIIRYFFLTIYLYN